MKNKFFYCNLLFVTICILLASCSSKNDINTNDLKSQELYRINVGGKFGFIDEKGNIMIEPQYDIANFYFSDSLCYAEIGEHSGLINPNGEFVTELNTEISWVYAFENGLAICMSTDGKMGLIDKNGTIILPIIYKDVEWNESWGLIIEDTLGKKGYVNCNGEFVISCKYDDVYGFSENLAVVAINNKWGYMDTLGNWAIDTVFDDARSFRNGLARVKTNEKWMFIDYSGNIVEYLNYDTILSGFSDNRAFVMEGDDILLINSDGKIIKKVDVDSVCSYREGYATFKQNGMFGKIDTLGNIFIPAKYNKIYDFEDGIARFELNGKNGIIDTAGVVLLDAVHNMGAGKFMEFSLLFGQDSIRGNYPLTYYDRDGNVIWKDMPGNKFVWPKVPTKEDYVAYFDSRLSELDPIEGVYYVSFNYYSVNRHDDHLSSDGTDSRFVAILPSGSNKEGYFVNFISDDDPYRCWVKKFVPIGESNSYAVVNSGENTNRADDGTLVLEDPYKFEVTLRLDGNNYYNWYVQCEFIKDYPAVSEYEQVQKAEWTGTGFAIADGYVVTNYHVTNGAKTIKVRGVNGDMKEAYKAYVVASDREHDIAIIKIVDKKFEGFENTPYCIGKSIPEVGDEIFVLGYPMTNTMGQEVKLTDGIISAASGFKGDQSMYQISAAVQPGNSGGPLFDNEGNVIGVVCAKHADAENANYAIKVSYLYSLVNSSGLGIKLSDNNKVRSKSLSQKVKQVKPFIYLIECRSH